MSLTKREFRDSKALLLKCVDLTSCQKSTTSDNTVRILQHVVEIQSSLKTKKLQSKFRPNLFDTTLTIVFIFTS